MKIPANGFTHAGKFHADDRANGIPYAAFGLLWRVLGPGLVG